MDMLMWEQHGSENTVGMAMALRYKSVNLLKRCETVPRELVYEEFCGTEMVVCGVSFQLCCVGSAAFGRRDLFTGRGPQYDIGIFNYSCSLRRDLLHLRSPGRAGQ